MVYLDPAQKLVVALVDARSAAVAGTPVPALDDAIAAVERAEAETGAELETTKLWGDLKTRSRPRPPPSRERRRRPSTPTSRPLTGRSGSSCRSPTGRT